MSKTSRARVIQVALVLSVVLAVGSLVLIYIGEPTLTRWLIVAGAFSNVMVSGILQGNERRREKAADI